MNFLTNHTSRYIVSGSREIVLFGMKLWNIEEIESQPLQFGFLLQKLNKIYQDQKVYHRTPNLMISSNIHMGSSNSCHYSSKVYILILCLIRHYDLFWLFWLSIRSCLAAQKSLTFQLLHIQARKIIIFLMILSRR